MHPQHSQEGESSPQSSQHKGPSLVTEPLQSSHVPGAPQPKPKHKWWPPRIRMPRTKKEWIITVIVIIALVGLSLGVYAIFFKKEAKAPASITKKPSTHKTTSEPLKSELMGIDITDPSINDRPVTAIMIENSPTARPQSGINYAGVVFEAIAEGGITRFLTLYQEGEPDYIGPVRSVRPYYIQWLLGFDAPVAHVGGSGDALRLLKEWHAKDLDQFYNSSAYHRISSRAAPHNMYTSIASLRDAESKKGYTTSDFTPIKRKTESPSKTPNATSITVTISSAPYNSHYDYDAASNAYKRSEGGAAHMVVDQAGKQTQLSPKVVVVLAMPKGKNDIYTTYQAVGGGDALIFQDGIATRATWHKDTNTAQITFTDEAGNALALNPGQTWFTAAGSLSEVSYQ
ncbi:MAG TPA: DUF3048 domain-containing protein [Candidatus Saccharimonadales bacterium]|nr:DUF3048 domain-containing protein [Candidatus Saccharimonadales bacterium]